MTKTNSLPRELFISAPTMDDLEAATELFAACDVAASTGVTRALRTLSDDRPAG